MSNFDFIQSGPIKIAPNRKHDQLIVKILQEPETEYWIPKSYIDTDCYLETVPKNSDEYKEIEDLFYDTKYKVTLLSIKRVQNPYLLGQYLLKKQEIEKQTGNVGVHKLFHGTKKSSIDSIITQGFNWRLNGENKGVRYGKGVNFTVDAGFTSHFGDKKFQKFAILSYVLIGNHCLGSEGMVLPPNGYDTTIKSDWKVVVKFEDYEHYPAYILKYKL